MYLCDEKVTWGHREAAGEWGERRAVSAGRWEARSTYIITGTNLRGRIKAGEPTPYTETVGPGLGGQGDESQGPVAPQDILHV